MYKPDPRCAVGIGREAERKCCGMATTLGNYRGGAMTLGLFVFLHLPRIAATPRNPEPWTSGFEILGMCGAALVLASSKRKD